MTDASLSHTPPLSKAANGDVTQDVAWENIGPVRPFDSTIELPGDVISDHVPVRWRTDLPHNIDFTSINVFNPAHMHHCKTNRSFCETPLNPDHVGHKGWNSYRILSIVERVVKEVSEGRIVVLQEAWYDLIQVLRQKLVPRPDETYGFVYTESTANSVNTTVIIYRQKTGEYYVTGVLNRDFITDDTNRPAQIKTLRVPFVEVHGFKSATAGSPVLLYSVFGVHTYGCANQNPRNCLVALFTQALERAELVGDACPPIYILGDFNASPARVYDGAYAAIKNRASKHLFNLIVVKPEGGKFTHMTPDCELCVYDNMVVIQGCRQKQKLRVRVIPSTEGLHRGLQQLYQRYCQDKKKNENEATKQQQQDEKDSE